MYTVHCTLYTVHCTVYSVQKVLLKHIDIVRIEQWNALVKYICKNSAGSRYFTGYSITRLLGV